MTSFGEVPDEAVLYTSNPTAGEAIGDAAFTAVRATLGINIPLFVDLTSSIELGSGAEPSVLTETWAASCRLMASRRVEISRSVFI
jgi:hypothetical protein